MMTRLYKPRKRLDDPEHREQVLTVNWFKRAYKEYDELIWAVPNGGHRHIKVAAKLKAEGVSRGVPDLHLAVQRGGYGALFIEMKDRIVPGKPKPRISPDQKAKIKALIKQGYAAYVAYGADEAKKILEEYMNL